MDFIELSVHNYITAVTTLSTKAPGFDCKWNQKSKFAQYVKNEKGTYIMQPIYGNEVVLPYEMENPETRLN